METSVNNSVSAVMNENNSISVSIRPTQAKQVAWQQFGKNFDSPVTIEEAIQEAGAGFKVNKQSLLRVDESVIEAIKNGNPLIGLQLSMNNVITSHCATVRDDQDFTLGVVGRDYGVVQNEKAFEFIRFIKEVSGQEPLIETAGVLGNGERMFVSARLGEDMYLDKTDAVKNYAVFTNSHDGSGAVMCFFTPIRVICQNTLNMAIKGAANKVVFKHTKYVGKRLDWEIEENRRKALEVFAKGVKFSEQFVNNMLQLKEETVTYNDVQDFAARLYLDDAKFKLYQLADRKIDSVEEISTRAKNQVQALKDSIENGIGQQNHRGTKLWLMNGLTTLLHNERKYKSAEDEFNSMMDGDAAKKVQKAYEILAA